MAIAKFEFDISTPEGKDDFEVYRRGREMASAIYDFEQILRSKYNTGWTRTSQPTALPTNSGPSGTALNGNIPLKISDAGLELIKKEEGLRLKAYKCPAGVWTIGYGHTGAVEPGMVITKEEAEDMLRADVAWAEDAVSATKTALEQHEFDALVSFVFNVGAGAYKSSTLLKLINMNRKEQAADEFDRWTKANGKVLPVLVARRQREKAMCSGN